MTTSTTAPTPAAHQVPFMAVGLDRADIDAAHAVLESGMLRSATKCAELEQRFAKISEAKHALTCANGTCALQLAYEPLFQPGDEVLVPAWTYIATASMLVARGCQPVFCDVHEDTFQIDVKDAARRITPRTRGIACTHLYGMPVDVHAVQKLAAEHNLKVVYDAAQAHLSTIEHNAKQTGIGAFGDAVTYSFYATKNLGTGEGGLISTNDDDLARQIALLRSHGETDKYLHESVGYNYRMNDVAGAIGCSKLDRLPDETDTRRANADRYAEILSNIEGLEAPTPTKGSRPAWHLYVAKLDLSRFTCTRDEFCDALKALGVPTAIHYPRSLTRQPAFKTHVEKNAELFKAMGGTGAHPTVSDRLSTRVFALPMHHKLTDAHFDQIEQALRQTAANFAR